MIIQNFTDSHVCGAACAAANQVTEMSKSMNKMVVVSIFNGTQQVLFVIVKCINFRSLFV